MYHFKNYDKEYGVLVYDEEFENFKKGILSPDLEEAIKYDTISLSRQNLSNLDLTWLVKLRGADLTDARLENTNMQGVHLDEANLKYADGYNVDLRNAYLSYTNFDSAHIGDIDFRGAHLYNTNFTSANISGADFRGAEISQINVNDANLSGAKINAKDLMCFVGANLRHVIICDGDDEAKIYDYFVIKREYGTAIFCSTDKGVRVIDIGFYGNLEQLMANHGIFGTTREQTRILVEFAKSNLKYQEEV